MTIDCVLKTWFKPAGEDDSRFYEVPCYDIRHYTGRAEFETKHALHIVHIDEDGDEGQTLAESTFVPDGKSTCYVHFCGASYAYDQAKDIIYSTRTRQEI